MTKNVAKELDFLKKSLQERAKTLEHYSGSLLKTSMTLHAKNRSLFKGEAVTPYAFSELVAPVRTDSPSGVTSGRGDTSGAPVRTDSPSGAPVRTDSPSGVTSEPGSPSGVTYKPGNTSGVTSKPGRSAKPPVIDPGLGRSAKPPVIDYVAGLEPHIPPKESPIDNAVYPEIQAQVQTHPNGLAIRATLNGHVDAQRAAMKAKTADGSYVTPHGELLHHLDQQRSLLMMDTSEYEANRIAEYIHDLMGQTKEMPAEFSDFSKKLLEAAGTYGPSSRDQAKKLGENRQELLRNINQAYNRAPVGLEKSFLDALAAKLTSESHVRSVADFQKNYIEEPHAEIQADREKAKQQIRIEDEYKKKASRMLWDQLERHLKSGNSLETFKGDYSKLGVDPKLKHAEQNLEEAASNMGKILWMNHRISAIGSHQDNPHSSAEFWTKRGFLGGVIGRNGPEGEDYLRNAVADKIRGFDPNANVKLFPLANTEYGTSYRVPQSQLEQEFLDQKGKQWASMAKKRFSANMQRWRDAQREKKEAVGELKALKNDPSQSEILGSSGLNSEVERLQQRIAEAEKKQVAFGNILTEDRHDELTSESDHFDPFFLDAIRRRHQTKQVSIAPGFHGSVDSDTRYRMAHDLENMAAINKRKRQEAALVDQLQRRAALVDQPDRQEVGPGDGVRPTRRVAESRAAQREAESPVDVSGFEGDSRPITPGNPSDHLDMSARAVSRMSMYDWKGNSSIAGGAVPVALSDSEASVAQTAQDRTAVDPHKGVFLDVMKRVFQDNPLAKMQLLVGDKGIQDLSRKALKSMAVNDEEKQRIDAMSDPYASLKDKIAGNTALTEEQQASELTDHLRDQFASSIANTNDKKAMYHFLQKIGVKNIPAEALPETGKKIDARTHFVERINDSDFQKRSLDPEFDPDQSNSQFSEWKNAAKDGEDAEGRTLEAYTNLLATDKAAARQFLQNNINKHAAPSGNLGLLARLIGPDYYDYMTGYKNSGEAKNGFRGYAQKLAANITDEMVDAFQAYVRTKHAPVRVGDEGDRDLTEPGDESPVTT